MTDRELMQQALDALEVSTDWDMGATGKQAQSIRAITALRARLSQPEQEPVAWWHDMGDVVDLNVSGRGVPLYTAPPQREWQGLTDDDIEKMHYDIKCKGMGTYSTNDIYRAIEAKLKQKNA